LNPWNISKCMIIKIPKLLFFWCFNLLFFEIQILAIRILYFLYYIYNSSLIFISFSSFIIIIDLCRCDQLLLIYNLIIILIIKLITCHAQLSLTFFFLIVPVSLNCIQSLLLNSFLLVWIFIICPLIWILTHL
jgi:hypothetical protein